MPTNSKPLVEGTQLGIAATLYYTVIPNTVTRITQATATNTTATPRTITVYIVPNAGSVGASTTIVQTYAVPANGQVILPWLIGQVMATGATIHALADAASAVTFRVSGDEIS